MRKQAPSRGRSGQWFGSRKIVSTVLRASLMAVIVWGKATWAIAQAASSGMQPPVGITTSPLATRSTRPAGIPLGSTEIATLGVSPVASPQGTFKGTCAGSDGARSSGTLFDGGGISGASRLSCADGSNISSPLPSPSSIGRVGIPVGATELGGAGISSATPLVGPGLSSDVGPANGTPAISNPSNP